MFQRQRMMSERVGAEDFEELVFEIWAYGEKSYDCHPGRMESYLKPDV